MAHLENTNNIAGGRCLRLLEAPGLVRGQDQRGPANGSHLAVQVQGVGGSVSGKRIAIEIGT